MNLASGYLPSTRHPWPCLLFVLPLVVAYEVGVLTLGGAQAETVRNGADHWVRVALGIIGLRFFWLPPAVLALALTFWAFWQRKSRPTDVVGSLSGMLLESVSFALGLWVVSRLLAPLLLRMGVELSLFATDPPTDVTEPGIRQVVTYLGAGIYEETLFRLILFTLLVWLLQFFELPRGPAIGVAAVMSAILFSAAHHVGPYGQEYSNFLFIFRLIAGLYFALLYEFRGFGIAVGTHACYNVMVAIPAQGP